MTRWSILLVLLLGVSCSSPHTPKASLDAQVNTAGESRGFSVVPKTGFDQAEVDALVGLVERLKSHGEDIDRITQIVFVAPTQARVHFLWSGGFHAGMLTVTKQNGAWTLKDAAYYP